MPDLVDQAIEDAKASPLATELMRVSRRYEDLRASPAWAELGAEVRARREDVIRILGEKALKGVDPVRLRDEAVYARGFLDGCETLLERPDKVEARLEALITESYDRLRSEMAEATLEASAYS